MNINIFNTFIIGRFVIIYKKGYVEFIWQYDKYYELGKKKYGIYKKLFSLGKY
jgi:hypothetical protein